MSSIYRVTKELQLMQSDENLKQINLSPINGNMLHLKGILYGLPYTPYEDGKYEFEIEFPADYPWKPPRVKFLTKIYSYYVHYQSGRVTLELLNSVDQMWNTGNTIVDVMSQIVDCIFQGSTDPLCFALSDKIPDQQYAVKCAECNERNANGKMVPFVNNNGNTQHAFYIPSMNVQQYETQIKQPIINLICEYFNVFIAKIIVNEYCDDERYYCGLSSFKLNCNNNLTFTEMKQIVETECRIYAMIRDSYMNANDLSYDGYVRIKPFPNLLSSDGFLIGFNLGDRIVHLIVRCRNRCGSPCLGGSMLVKDDLDKNEYIAIKSKAYRWSQTVEEIGLMNGNNEQICLYFKYGDSCHGLRADICNIRPPENLTDDQLLQNVISESINVNETIVEDQLIQNVIAESMNETTVEEQLLQLAIQQSLQQ